MKRPIRIAVTGPCGHIGYSLLFRIAAGNLFGADQPVELRLLDRQTPESGQKLLGTMMELSDCAFPTLAEMTACNSEEKLFEDAQCVFLVGARPRGPGMDRSDLLKMNGEIFQRQGRALDSHAARDVRVVVVGNPCNTNAFIAMKNAPSLSPTCFSALMRLDQNRAQARVAEKLQVPVADVQQVFVWGNHSNTMVTDLRFLRKNNCPVENPFIGEEYEAFLKNVATRGGQIIKARGASSAASAASAAIDHMRDWVLGAQDRIVTMAVPSDGAYGITEGLVFGFPCLCTGEGRYQIIKDLPITPEVQARLDVTRDELMTEAQAVKDLLP